MKEKKDRSLLKETEILYGLKNWIRNFLFRKRFLNRLRHNPKSFKLNSGAVPERDVEINDILLL